MDIMTVKHRLGILEDNTGNCPSVSTMCIVKKVEDFFPV